MISSVTVQSAITFSSPEPLGLRWLDGCFQDQFLPSVNINYIIIDKDLEKLLPLLW